MARVMRYVGGAPAAIFDTPFQFQVYGQLVSIPDELVERALELPLIDAKDWDQLGHTETELRRWSRFESLAIAEQDPDGQRFLAKRKMAWMVLHKMREAKPESVVVTPQLEPEKE